MKAPVRRHHHGTPFQLPPGAAPGQGLTLEPSPDQMGAAARGLNKEAMGMGDQATTLESLAQIAPISQQTRMRGPALEGLKRAASL